MRNDFRQTYPPGPRDVDGELLNRYARAMNAKSLSGAAGVEDQGLRSTVVGGVRRPQRGFPAKVSTMITAATVDSDGVRTLGEGWVIPQRSVDNDAGSRIFKNVTRDGEDGAEPMRIKVYNWTLIESGDAGVFVWITESSYDRVLYYTNEPCP